MVSKLSGVGHTVPYKADGTYYPASATSSLLLRRSEDVAKLYCECVPPTMAIPSSLICIGDTYCGSEPMATAGVFLCLCLERVPDKAKYVDHRHHHISEA
jgi:hypothetical protein